MNSFKLISLVILSLSSVLALAATDDHDHRFNQHPPVDCCGPNNDYGPTDPGPRQGPVTVGDPLSGLSTTEQQLFNDGKEEFSGVEGVPDGLGPRFNLDSCAGCHAQPAVGGTSPAINPQVNMATKNGGTDEIPSFITANGPIREARYKQYPDGSPDGGVHNTGTINQRAGSPIDCNLEYPDFDRELSRGNIIFRIPTPLFGVGLIEQIPDSEIIANLAAFKTIKHQRGIRGRPNITGRTNTNGNDGTISRFGWKAQNKSLLLFSGEAYSVEMGVTNELFQTERDETAACQVATQPNSITETGPSDIELFAAFQRFLAPPEPVNVSDPVVSRGRQAFDEVGCTLCHTPTLRTGNSTVDSLRNNNVNLYSDLALHQMGSALADGIQQGDANGNEFRTAPLWGLGQRLFFLHDGRTSDLVEAIKFHNSSDSEANQVVEAFNVLSDEDKQAILNFLRSL